jgi:predicted glutamine amidotransferase
MCRWMAWHGQPVPLEELLFKTKHGLVDQSLHSRLGAETTNGDGFGIGWYGEAPTPGVYRSVLPAWGDANLRHLAGHIESPLFLAHVRATSGTAVQETNCHPFAHDRWLFVHNGLINDFHAVRRDLMIELDAPAFAAIEGSTDSELIFHLALARGLEDDPVRALEATLGQVEETQRRNGVEPALQASIGVSDGRQLWAVRYSSEGRSRTLFTSADVESLRRLHPDNPRLQLLREGDRLVVSEPFADLPGAWHEIPESTALFVDADGRHEMRPFMSKSP